MNTMVLLTLISVIGAAALFIALAVYLVLISGELERIGGKRPTYGEPSSYLSKIRLGVRAIETQTGGLVPHVTRLNGGLSAVRDGLRAIDTNLGGVIAAVVRQEAK
ncbi:MAG: hypothetical protein M3434_09835 [Gemmatimonadota bacterium]|jgi:hypothetical protein|nr:hypothetical protein [Gemmatimonadota bacterium]